MRIASFNVENFFDRVRALSAPATDARALLTAYADLTNLLQQDVYGGTDKTRIVNLLDTLGLKNSDSAAMALLRQVRGRLVSRTSTGVHVVADGRGDWVGWVELTTEPVGDTAILNTARVITDVAPDVLGVVEAEDRIVLKRFADAELRVDSGPVFPHVMLVDGNDDRGIDVAVLTRDGWPVTGIRSHVDDVDDEGLVFSRDCPEYEIRTPGGHRLVVLMNHLKSKGYGRQSDNDARRRRQAERVAAIYRRLRGEGVTYVAVLGDFNDTPDSGPLQPLLDGTDLRDVSEHPAFDDGGRPGTFGSCTAANRIDYVLMSPALFAKCTGGGIFRRGAWGGKNGTLWPHYDTLASAVDAASDHCAIYADLTLT